VPAESDTREGTEIGIGLCKISIEKLHSHNRTIVSKATVHTRALRRDRRVARTRFGLVSER